MRRAHLTRLLCVCGAVSAFAAPRAAIAGTYDPIASGATAIVLAPSFLTLLHRHGVRILARDGAEVDGARIAFPVSGGRVDPVAVRGIVEHEGSVLLVAGRRRLPLRDLTLKTTQKRSPLAAKLGGGKLKIASSSRLTTARTGFGLRARVSSIELSDKVATRLGKKLRLSGVFGEGQRVGSATTSVQPARVDVLGENRATLVPAPGFLGKLQELFVAMNPVSPAELALGPAFSFPIEGGALAPDVSGGEIAFGGSVEFLQLGGGQIFWKEPRLDFDTGLAAADVDFEPSPPYPGKEGAVGILGFGGGTRSSAPGPRTISAQGETLSLSVTTAAEFNRAFAAPQGREGVFAAGEAMGSLSFTAQGR